MAGHPRAGSRRAPSPPEATGACGAGGFLGRLRFRAGKKSRWFGRRWRRVVREARANRFPESNRAPLQFLLMAWGLLPAIASRLRALVLGKRKERIHRSGRFTAWFDREKRLHSILFLGGSCVLAGVILFFSFFTVGTTVTYDGHVLGNLASKSEAESVRHELEVITSETLGDPIPSTIPFSITIPAGCAGRTLRIRTPTKRISPMSLGW